MTEHNLGPSLKETDCIPHPILVINDPSLLDDPHFMSDLHTKIALWCNEMGLRGKKILSIFCEHPSGRSPFDVAVRFYAQIACTEEERKAWERQQASQLVSALGAACSYEEDGEKDA